MPNTDFDAAIGQTIYADPNKTIFKVLPIDFNKDGIKDLLVVYTDGSIKLVKNYGGTNPYKNLQELMIVADTIKDVKVGDVDGNGYDDIVITTTNNK
ncbi:MAG: VCBS repeat-containing protein [bacterium]